MDILRQLIQTIVVIVILAVFLEMLLPRGDMRRYVKMVMGLLIIVAVLQAVTGAINSDLLQEIPDVTHSPFGYEPVPLEEIMAAGQSLSLLNREEASRRYSEGISRQVMSLAGLNESIRVTDARVRLKEGSSEISRITIFCSAAGDETQTPPPGGIEGPAVQPVIVSTSEKDVRRDSEGGYIPTENEMKAAAKMAEVVANFYNLRPEQVEIEFE